MRIIQNDSAYILEVSDTTQKQTYIMKFLTKYHPELIKAVKPLEPDLIQADGKRFSINLYGDIVNYDSRMIIARSNLPHNVCTMCGEMEPTDWVPEK